MFKPEHLIAIYVDAGRRKDREMISRLFEQHDTDEDFLKDILKRYDLYNIYLKNKRWCYE